MGAKNKIIFNTKVLFLSSLVLCAMSDSEFEWETPPFHAPPMAFLFEKKTNALATEDKLFCFFLSCGGYPFTHNGMRAHKMPQRIQCKYTIPYILHIIHYMYILCSMLYVIFYTLYIT